MNKSVEVGVGAVVLWDDKVLLIQRGRPPRDGQWSIPGGRQKYGETLGETAIREVKEETNISIEPLMVLDAFDLTTEDGRQFALIDFLAKPLNYDAVAGDDAKDARWVPLNTLEEYGMWDKTIAVIRKAVAQNA